MFQPMSQSMFRIRFRFRFQLIFRYMLLIISKIRFQMIYQLMIKTGRYTKNRMFSDHRDNGYREYFKEVSIETETIVETIENGQGCDLKKETCGFQVAIQGCDSQP